jgi:hypothetical protein
MTHGKRLGRPHAIVAIPFLAIALAYCIGSQIPQ